MTPEEFKSKFKVGDVVSSKMSSSYDVLITGIGEESFLGIESNSHHKQEYFYMQKADWFKVEPKRKPSEEIKEKIAERSSRWYIDTNFICLLEWLDENWKK